MSTNTADLSLASTEAARAAYMRKDDLTYWVKSASAAERKREKERFISPGNGMSSSFQGGH